MGREKFVLETSMGIKEADQVRPAEREQLGPVLQVRRQQGNQLRAKVRVCEACEGR